MSLVERIERHVGKGVALRVVELKHHSNSRTVVSIRVLSRCTVMSQIQEVDLITVLNRHHLEICVLLNQYQLHKADCFISYDADEATRKDERA